MNTTPPVKIKIRHFDGREEILIGDHHTMSQISDKFKKSISTNPTIFLKRPGNGENVLVNLSNIVTVEEFDEEEYERGRKVHERLAFGKSDKRLAFGPSEHPIKKDHPIDTNEFPFVDESGARYRRKDVIWINRMCSHRMIWVIGYFTVQSYDLCGDSLYWESVSIDTDADLKMYQAAHDEEKYQRMGCPEFIITGTWTESSWAWYKEEQEKNGESVEWNLKP